MSTVIDTPNLTKITGDTDNTLIGNNGDSLNVAITAFTAGSLPLPAGASTAAKQDIGNLSLVSIDSKIPANLTVNGTMLEVDGSGVTQPISASSLPLPTGAATAALQTSGNSSLSSIDGKVPVGLTIASLRLLVDGSGVTQPISASALPLPSGASTSALQTSGNSSLTSIDGKIPANLTVIATRLLTDGSGVTQPVSAAALPLPTGAATSANQTTGNSSLSSIDSKLNSLGQKTMVNSMPVVLSSDQSVIPVSQSGTWNIGNITGSVSLPTGAATSAKQPSIGTAGSAATDILTIQGITGMTAVKVDGSATTQPISGSITANAGTNLNTSLLALESGGNLATINTNTAPLALSQASTTSGQKGNLTLAAASTAAPIYTNGQSNPLSLTLTGLLRVDGSGVTQPVSGTITANPGVSSTATLTSVTATTSSGTILAANSSRKRFSIYNDAGKVVYIAMAATASTTSFTFQLVNNGFYDSDSGVIYTGIITAVVGSGSGAVRITEYT